MAVMKSSRLKYLFVVSCVSTLTFLLIITLSKSMLTKQPLFYLDDGGVKHEFSSRHATKRGFLLDTPDCKIPNTDPFDPSVMRQLSPGGEILCPENASITYIHGSTLRLNRTSIENHFKGNFKYCQYHPVRRTDLNSDFAFAYGDLRKPFDSDILLPPEDEFLLVYCYGPNKIKISTNFHAAVIPKESVERKSEHNLKEHIQKNTPKEIYNVHMIGVDSVSRLNFIRQMQQTRRFLHNELKAFEMSTYNKVADNTFVNIVPMMVGKFVNEIGWNETLAKEHFDKYNFLWKNFSKAGYRTLYAEDAPLISIFVYAKEGFHTPPADYYNRPLAIAMEKHKAVWSKNHHCVADRLETAMLLDYVTDFSRVFRDKPHFGFTFITRLTHDSMEMVGSADFAYLKFLKRFKEEGHFNNTVMILYSDHGLRFGKMRASYIGKVEERLPFMYLIFPPSFHTKYPALVKNLRTNARRLTTPFDIYETLKDILYFDGQDRKADIKSRGISLLREVPAQRTCEHAEILPHWCLCLEQKKLQTTSELANQIAQAVVSHINKQLSSVSHICAKLQLKSVSDVVEMQTNDKVLRFSDSFHEVINRVEVYGNKAPAPIVYQVTLTTLPGSGQFEATLIYYTEINTYKLGGAISRINSYKKRSKCVNNVDLKKFCFCNS